jgi:hypothetical protein
LAGFVENLKPYDVKIVAEGEEDILGEFITQIRIDEPPISVEDIDVEFGAATREFEYFEIRRGDWGEELGERMDALLALLSMYVELQEKYCNLGEVSGTRRGIGGTWDGDGRETGWSYANHDRVPRSDAAELRGSGCEIRKDCRHDGETHR